MAFGDGAPQGPDFGAMLALINSSKGTGGSGCAPGLMGIRLEQNVGSCLSPQGKGLNCDKTFAAAAPRQDRGLCKILKDIVNLADLGPTLKKISDAGPVKQVNSIAEIFGQGGPGGGSFVSALNDRGDSGIPMG